MTDTTPPTFLARAEALLAQAREHSWARDAYPEHDPTDQPSHRDDRLAGWNRAHADWERIDELQAWATGEAVDALRALRDGGTAAFALARRSADDAVALETMEAGREEAPTFGRFALAVELTTLTRTAVLDRVQREFARVFQAHVEVDSGDGVAPEAPVSLIVTGWPERAVSDPFLALAVLSDYKDGDAKDAEGDAEVCKALEKEGAVPSIEAPRR